MDCFPVVLLVLCGIFTCPLAVDITDVDDYDPGSCDKSNVLQVVSLKDKNDGKKLWICSNENGTYLWKPVDGHATIGEFLNPGYDCSDILNHEPDAQDGFYWVTFKTKTKRKVWCDMTTDGGGYMLVARKHDAAVWDVPSKDQPADPKSSETYWTSQLGDAPILDFMIQMSDSDSFQDTKAQWAYRLKNKRVLGQLMINDRGCTSLTPGIGDIAYVRDLKTEKIVTTTFECSVFGNALSHGLSSYKVGWTMMNECLKKPCSGAGYLHLTGHAIALDHTGAFSYSVSNTKSGISNDATAFIGCLHKKCCGCFGPLGGTGNYCNSNCNGTLGGTIVDSKEIFTWIWVRSSPPERIWNRCMEYQRQNSNGQDEWYKLVGNAVIPQKGRCSNPEQLRLNSGVVVAPDNVAAEKVPRIPGLLEYRKDQKKLYLLSNKTWKSLSEDEEVKEKLTLLKQNFVAELEEAKKNTTVSNALLKQSVDVGLEQTKKDITILKKRVDDGLAKTKKNTTDQINALEIQLNQSVDAKKNFKLTMKILETIFQISGYEKLANYLIRNPQCTRYTWLTDGNRYRGFSSSTNTKCDSHLSGWYRFGGAAGTQMYTSCRSNYYCNANYPGYLSNGHPSVSDGIVTRTVCFYYSGSCCGYYSRSIKVLNCGSYYVYELNGTPRCNMRYCGTN